MERTQLPSAEQFQQKVNTAINNATNRYQAAITNPNALNPSIQPTMHPADTFFPSTPNPPITTCLVCGTPFETYPQLSQHVQTHHAAIYRPPPVQMPPLQPFTPFPVTNPLLPLNPFQPSNQLSNPWAPTTSALQTPTPQTSAMQTSPMQTSPMQTPISVPSSIKHVQPYRCDVCDIGCDTSDILRAHLVGQKHRKKHELRAAFLKVAPTLQHESISQIDPRIWMCHLCQTKMDSENAVLQHLEATKHKRLRQNPPPNDHHKRLRKSPVTALQAADVAAATPVSAALAVLKDDNPTLPPCSTPFSQPQLRPNPFLTTTLPPSAGHTSQRPGPPRAAISKNPRSNQRNASQQQQQQQSFSCGVCYVTCNSMDSLNAHLSSSRHKRKQNLVEAANNPTAATAAATAAAATAASAASAAATPPPSSSQNIRCEVCAVMICGQANYESHIKGKQHAKKLRAQGQDAPTAAPQSPASTSVSPAPTPPRPTQVTVTPIQPPTKPPSLPPAQPPIRSPFQAAIQPPFQAPIQSPNTSNSATTKDPGVGTGEPADTT